MKSFWLLMATMSFLACGGGSGGAPAVVPPVDPPPVIAQMTLSPDNAHLNDGGGSVTASLNLSFQDTDGDVATLRLAAGGNSQDLPITGAAGITNGTLNGLLTISTEIVGDITFTATLLDSKSRASNSSQATFHIWPPAPTMTNISPNGGLVGGPAFILTVQGTGFCPDSTVLWGGQPLSTTYVSAVELQASVPAQDLAMAGTSYVTVSNPTNEGGPQPNGQLFQASSLVIHRTAVPANDVAWDAARGVLYASVPGSAGTIGNAILVIDPATGAITASAQVGSEPNRLALSGDGQYLYVGLDGSASVQRLVLPALTLDLTIPLGSDANAGPYQAVDLQVAPGFPHTFAVALGTRGGGSGTVALALYDDGTVRAGTVPGAGTTFRTLQWGADPSTLFASPGSTLMVLAADAGGLSVKQTYPGVLGAYGAQLHFDGANGSLYADTGQVLAPLTGAPLGAYQANGALALDRAQGLAFFLETSTFTSEFTILSFNLGHFTPAGAVSLFGGQNPTYPAVPSRLFRWGQDGLAFGGNGYAVTTVHGGFIQGQPPALPPAAPTLTFLSPNAQGLGGPSFQLAVQGTGFFPDSTVTWNAMPLPTTYVSPSELLAAVPASDLATQGVADISVSNPPAEGGPVAFGQIFTIGPATNFSLETLPYLVNDLIYDPLRKVVYASLPSGAGAYGNSIALLDPATGTIKAAVFAGSEPDRLALSGDGQYLYVGVDGTASIQRFILPGLTQDLNIPLGADASRGPYLALDLQVAPGLPHTLAVTLGINGYPPATVGGVVIYDDGVPRATRATNGYFSSLQWGADAGTLLSANNENTGFDCYLLAVDGAGVSLRHDVPNALKSFGNRLHFEPATASVYSDTGQVLSPLDGSPLGTFQASGPMTADPAQGLAFFVTYSGGSGAYALLSFNLADKAPLGSVRVPVLNQASFLPLPLRVQRWGQDGLVFGGNGNAVYLIRGAFVQGH